MLARLAGRSAGVFLAVEPPALRLRDGLAAVRNMGGTRGQDRTGFEKSNITSFCLAVIGLRMQLQ